jgi:uncharacterized membrane protein (DUF373 family)
MSRALNGLLRVYNVVEKVIIVTLLVVLMLVVPWACGIYSFELLRLLVLRMTTGEVVAPGVLSITERMSILREVFGGFLLILIGVELMKTIAMYLSSHEMHVEVVFTVAIIAIARHAIDLDLAHLDPMQLVGLAALLVALSLGYYFFKRAAAIASPPADRTPLGG